jgi:hypothetical protein
VTAVAEANLLVISVEAGADLSDYGGYFVKLSGGKAVPITAATDKPAGVLEEGVASGKVASLVVQGGVKVRSAGAITAGDGIGPSANGRADPKVPGTDTTNFVAGTAYDTVASADVLVHCVVDCANPHRAA